MEIKILKDEKNDLEVEINNLTIVELLRVYLNKDEDIELVAWKREHPTKSPILKIKTKSKSAKKVLHDAISDIEKELEKFESEFKASKAK